MHTKTVVLLAFISVIKCHDITIGSNEGRKIFDETRQASPAIWRQFENVTIIAPNNEIISGVVVTDVRPDKDGDVKIVDGGEGSKTVTIELKSPTVLRGYEFHIKVFAVPETQKSDADENMTKNQENDAAAVETEEKTTELPEANQSTTLQEKEDTESEVSHSVEAVTTEEPESDDKDVPASVGKETGSESAREARMTQYEDEYHLDINSSKLHVSESSSETDEESNEESEEHSSTESDLSITTESGISKSDITEIPESSIKAKDAPTSIGIESEMENTRPARETQDEDESKHEENISTEADLSITTESNLSTKSADEEVTVSPDIIYENKNTPDYPALSILDLIKSKESARQIRRTEDNTEEHDATESLVENGNIGFTTTESSYTPRDETVNSSDDTADLTPPEIDSSYNDKFNTESSVETSTAFENIRIGRRIEEDQVEEEEATVAPTMAVEVATSTLDNESSENITESMMAEDEQSRNVRDARKNPEDEDINFDATNESTQDFSIQNDGAPICPTNGLNINSEPMVYVTDANNKIKFALPIVFIIAGDTSLPTIRIIAEDGTKIEENKDINTPLISDISLKDMVTDYKNYDDKVDDDSDFSLTDNDYESKKL